MKAFISYTKADEKLKIKFRKHLKTTIDKHNLVIFDDHAIKPGETWEKRIWDEFNDSEIIFLLISIDFLNSDFCFNKELKKAIEKHNKKTATVIPVILKSCHWSSIEGLGSIQALPRGGHIIGGKFANQDIAFTEIALHLDAMLHDHKKRKIKKIPNNKNKEYKSTRYKAVFFDLDGTLLREKENKPNFKYSWQLVWSFLGFPDSVRHSYHQEYLNNIISYERWCDITRDIFRENKLKKADFFTIAKDIKLTHNCKLGLKTLRDKNLITVLVSGGIDSFLDVSFKDYGNYFDYVFINKFHYDSMDVLEKIEITNFDFEKKFDAITKVCNEKNIKYSECVFVGDGKNDAATAEMLRQYGGLTIAYPPAGIADSTEIEIKKNNLMKVLDVIFDNSTFQWKF